MKIRIHNIIIAEDSEFWDVIYDGTHVSIGKITKLVAKAQREYDEEDHNKFEKISRLRNFWCVE